MKRATCWFLISSTLMPTLAYADVNFYVRNESAKSICIYCGGPWFRLGFSNPISSRPTGPFLNFYIAETNIFSPFGAWGCGIKAATDPSNCEWQGTLPTETTHFCVSDQPGVAVHLTVNSDDKVTSDKPPQPCNNSAVFSFLGNSGNSPAVQNGTNKSAYGSKPAQGAYRFTGKGGETISVTLDRDGARGSEGEVAQLTLGLEGKQTLGQGAGKLPLTFTAKLPSTGTYDLAVDDAPSENGKAFRGYYQLSVTATSGDAIVLEPIDP